jgi:hypothetical protein
MTTKRLTLAIASVLSLLLLVSLVSATITFTSVPTLSKSSGTHTADIVITSNETETITFNAPVSITQSGKTITFIQPSDISLVANTPETMQLQYTVPSGFEFQIGKTYSTNLIADGTISPQKSQSLSFASSSYCSVENEGNLKVDIRDINVIGFSDNDDEWYLLDEVEIEIRIDNDGDEDVENIEVEYALYSSDGDLIFNDDVDELDIDEGDDETLTFTFEIDPDDFDSDNEDYILYVKATGEIADGVNEGENTCDSDSQNVKVIFDRDFVILDNIEITPETAQCSSTVRLTADAWNIGSRDQNDVEVLISSSSLKISQRVEVGDIDTIENEKISFEFTIPEDAPERTHSIELVVYDEDGDIYESDNDDESRFSIHINVDGACGVIGDSVSVDASLESDAKAGKDLIVKTIITNTGNKILTFNLVASDYSDWADTASFSQNSVALNAGESKEITLTLGVKKDSSGEQSFNIDVSSDGELVMTQPVSVDIEKSGLSFDLGDSWYLWAIGALNIILVIIIIIVAIRVARG